MTKKRKKKKLKHIRMGEQHCKIFIKAVANFAKLYFYDPSKETRIKCDASHSCLGGILEQRAAEGNRMPILFESRFLNAQEKKCLTNELELLAVVWSVDQFKHYL